MLTTNTDKLASHWRRALHSLALSNTHPPLQRSHCHMMESYSQARTKPLRQISRDPLRKILKATFRLTVILLISVPLLTLVQKQKQKEGLFHSSLNRPTSGIKFVFLQCALRLHNMTIFFNLVLPNPKLHSNSYSLFTNFNCLSPVPNFCLLHRCKYPNPLFHVYPNKDLIILPMTPELPLQ